MTGSTVTEEYCPTGKLVVHIAENGHSIQLDCDQSSLVEDVQKFIESLSGIQSSDQLLLCQDMKLESHRLLSDYNLPEQGRDVYLYNRVRLQRDSIPPPPEQITLPDYVQPPSSSLSKDIHPLDNALDPALKALPSYERQFRNHFLEGRSIYELTQVKFEACNQFLAEQKVQEKALETARDVMEHHYRITCQQFGDFIRCFLQQHHYHSDLLLSFNRVIDRLRACKLHPVLQTDSRKCLLDLVKVENLKKSAENCRITHKQFEGKVLQLKNVFEDLSIRAEDLNLQKATSFIHDVETALKDHQTYLTEQKSILQTLSKDVNTVKNLVDDCSNSKLSASLRPHDAVAAVGPMYDIHDKNHLPKMQACDHAMSKLLDFCKAKKEGMNLFVHHFLQEIACIQSMVKDMRLQFPAFREAMARQDDIFGDLKFICRLGPAYRACLAEVVRRKASMQLYMGMAGQLAERLAAKREAEARRREEFIKEYSIYIPHELFTSMGLLDTPTNCDVNVVPFDTHLLDVDIMDLDYYAPENLLGLSSKMRTDFSKISTEASNLTENRESFEANELLGKSQDCEIAGTCKLEVENARLKAELASALARLCCLNPEINFVSLDDSEMQNYLRNAADKTEEALRMKDEYVKHLQSILKSKQLQCVSYEKRIQELELKLTDQLLQEQRVIYGNSVSCNGDSPLKMDEHETDAHSKSEVATACVSGECSDASSCGSPLPDMKLDQLGASANIGEASDGCISDFLGLYSHPAKSSAPSFTDASMHDPHQDSRLILEVAGHDKNTENCKMPSCNAVGELQEDGCGSGALLQELKIALADKSSQYDEIMCKLNVANEEIISLKMEVKINQGLLHESQINCAHLENCLHDAREEAQRNLCAADRRASEYNSLRVSAVKMRSIGERLRSCVTTSGFANSLHALSVSLASSIESDDDGIKEFRACIKVFVDKTSFLLRQHEELLERCSKAETANAHAVKELDDKKEIVKNLYAKHQLEKQASKEKISFRRFELHELAAFVLNSAGHYEAINQSCSNYFLSQESVALFAEYFPSRPNYIIGQIVHIEKRTVHAPGFSQSDPVDSVSCDSIRQLIVPKLALVSNPYNVPVGCEYFIITVAMLPNPVQPLLS